MLEISRRSNVPGIWDHETSALVQLAEGLALIGNGGHDCALLFVDRFGLSGGPGRVGCTAWRALASRKSWGRRFEGGSRHALVCAANGPPPQVPPVPCGQSTSG